MRAKSYFTHAGILLSVVDSRLKAEFERTREYTKANFDKKTSGTSPPATTSADI